MLMSKAEEEAIACAERIAGLPGYVNYSSIPYVLYAGPEVAMIGKTEDELRGAGAAYRVGYCPHSPLVHAPQLAAPPRDLRSWWSTLKRILSWELILSARVQPV